MRHDEIVEQIGKLSETTAELKSQLEKPKSKLDRFKEYAGVISLLLSLATGFFAVYSSFVAEPQKSKTDAQAKLHDTLAQIVTLDQEYMKALQQGDPNANNGALESKRNILLQQAEDLASRSGVASAEDQLNLGNQYQFGNLPEAALHHFNDALLLAGKDPLRRATADTSIGRLNFYGISNTTVDQGRKHFADAEQVLAKPASLQTGIALVQSLGIRSWVECSLGDPALGLQAHQRAQDELEILARDPAASPQVIDTFRTGLATGLNNTHCAEGTPSATATSRTTPVALGSGASIPTSRIERSNHMMQLLVARNYAAFETNMTAAAQAQVPEARLRAIWEQVSAATGNYQQTLTTKTKVTNNITYYIVHGRCEKALVNLALAFDDTGRVSFLLLTPLSALPAAEIEHRASQAATAFFEEKFKDLYSGFDEPLKNQLSTDRLQQLFSQATTALGHFDRVVGETKDRDLDVIDVLCQLQGGRTTVRVSYDFDMKVNGFVILPAQ